MEAEKDKKLRSLTNSLSIAFITLSVSVLLISGSFAIYYHFQTQRENVAVRQQHIARDAANVVSKFIQEKFSILETAVKLENPVYISPEEQKNALQILLGLQPAFRHLVLLDSQEKKVAGVSRLPQVALKRFMSRFRSDLFSRVKQGNGYIGPVYVDEVTSEPLVIMAVPVTDIFGDFQGALITEVNLKFMWDLVERLKVGETGLAYVVDRLGNLIAFGDIARVLRGENIARLKEVSEFISNSKNTNEAGVNMSKGINGATIVGTYVPLGTPDWAVVIELPVKEAYQKIFQSTVISAVIMLVMAILAGLTGVKLARRLAVPLLNLTGTATRIADGQIELLAAVEGPLEVARLARAFNNMTGQLREMLSKEEERTRKLQQEIVHRQQAEEALKFSLDRFRIVMDSLDAAVYVADMETYELLFLNKYAKGNWGDVVGQTCWKVLQSDMTGPCSFCTNEKLVDDNGKPVGVYAWEFQNTMNNQWYDCRDQAVQWVDGRIVRMEIATNITERKRQEEALRKYEHIISSTSDLISFIDRDYVYQAVNEFYLKAHQKEYAEIVGHTVVDLHGPKIFNEVIKKELDRCMAGEEIRYQEWFDYPGLGRRFMDVVYTPYLDASGEASGVVVNIRDITQRKLAEEKTKEGRNYLENVLRNSPDAIGIVNERGRFTEWNSAAEYLIGYSFEELKGTSFAALYPDKEALDRMLRKLRREGYIRRYEIDMINKKGNIIPFEMSISILRDENNRNIGSVCVARDLSERKRTMDELAKYRDHLEELVSVRTRELKEAQEELVHKERLAVLGQLTATVSHELRNPLGTVRTSVFSIGDAIKRNDFERVDRALQLAERNIQRCDGIIAELLDFTRKRELKPEPMVIDSWLKDLLDEQSIPEGIEYGRELRSDLVFPIAHEHLRRAVINVITNAVQALQDIESSRRRLTIESVVAGGRLEIRVIDTGPGITADVLEKAFEPLFSTKGFGIGLGLPIVKDIMEEHGGGVEIWSKPGKGTSVTLWLPLKPNN